MGREIIILGEEPLVWAKWSEEGIWGVMAIFIAW